MVLAHESTAFVEEQQSEVKNDVNMHKDKVSYKVEVDEHNPDHH